MFKKRLIKVGVGKKKKESINLTIISFLSSKFILSRGKLSIIIGVLGPKECVQRKEKGRQEKEI